jgi:hypothetical protein
VSRCVAAITDTAEVTASRQAAPITEPVPGQWWRGDWRSSALAQPYGQRSLRGIAAISDH